MKINQFIGFFSKFWESLLSYVCMYYVINELTSTLSRLFWVEVKEWRWGDRVDTFTYLSYFLLLLRDKMSSLKPNPTRRSNHLVQSKKVHSFGSSDSKGKICTWKILLFKIRIVFWWQKEILSNKNVTTIIIWISSFARIF